ncbi:hypothetical protein ALO77_200000 [Pseudomonas coronafaciens pv. garcae]|nr:hypothetical protein ALO77_200000 [Pseudomonas coronafaciens pv. garcae]
MHTLSSVGGRAIVKSLAQPRPRSIPSQSAADLPAIRHRAGRAESSHGGSEHLLHSALDPQEHRDSHASLQTMHAMVWAFDEGTQIQKEIEILCHQQIELIKESWSLQSITTKHTR